MEIKKSPKVELESKKQLYFLCGLVLVLAVLLLGFEWATKDVKKFENVGVEDANFEEELVPQTLQQDVPPPPPPPPPAVVEELKIVEDTKEVADVEIATSEDDQKTQQQVVFTPPVVEEEDPAENQIFTIVEDMPVFPGGGEAALTAFISKNTRYPVVAAENGIHGRVICSFVVDKEGKVVDAVVLRGVDPSLDKEALRVINSQPRWKPGMQRGKPVKVKFTVPVLFRLN